MSGIEIPSNVSLFLPSRLALVGVQFGHRMVSQGIRRDKKSRSDYDSADNA